MSAIEVGFLAVGVLGIIIQVLKREQERLERTGERAALLRVLPYPRWAANLAFFAVGIWLAFWHHHDQQSFGHFAIVIILLVVFQIGVRGWLKLRS